MSQVVAGDDATILEVTKTPDGEGSELVELHAGAVLQVTPDHLVARGDGKESVCRAAGQFKVGDARLGRALRASACAGAARFCNAGPPCCRLLLLDMHPFTVAEGCRRSRQLGQSLRPRLGRRAHGLARIESETQNPKKSEPKAKCTSWH